MNSKKIIATVFVLLFSLSTFSQGTEPVEKQLAVFPEWAKNPDLYIVSLLIIIMMITILVLSRINGQLLRALSPEAFEEKVSISCEVEKEIKPSLIHRIYLRLVDSVPVEKEKDVLLDHDYDGIKELDNNLPPWWKYGFYLTILFGVIYMINYHVAKTGKLQLAEYKEELLLADQEKAERLKNNLENVNEDNVVLLFDGESLSTGKESFIKLCSPCHRSDAGGVVGPNLTDEFWLHGGGIKNVFKTITYGVPNKGMLSWKSQLSPKQIQEVASYILSLKGTNPPAPKEPQGDQWIEVIANAKDSLNAVTKDSTINF